MLFFIPLAMSIFFLMSWHLIKEAIWHDLPLTIGQIREIIKTIMGPPRRWEPAVVDNCANVFSPEFILEHSLPPEKPLGNWQMTRAIYLNLLDRYPNLEAYIFIAVTFLILALVSIAIRISEKLSTTDSFDSESFEAWVQSLIHGQPLQLPVTSIAPHDHALNQLQEAHIKSLQTVDRRNYQIQSLESITAQQKKELANNVTSYQRMQQEHEQEISRLRSEARLVCSTQEEEFGDLQAKVERQKVEHEQQMSLLVDKHLLYKQETEHKLVELQFLNRKLEVNAEQSSNSLRIAQHNARDLQNLQHQSAHDLQVAKSQLSKESEKYKTTMAEKDALQADLDGKTVSLQELQKKLAHIEQKSMADIDLKQKIIDEHKLNAQQEQDQRAKVLGQLRTNIIVLEKKLEEQDVKWHTEVDQKQKTIEQLTTNTDSEKARLQAQLNGCHEEIKKLKDQVQELESKSEDVRASAQKCKLLEQSMENATTEKSNLQKQVSEGNAKAYHLEKKVEKLEAELNKRHSNDQDDKQKIIDMLIENTAAEKALLQRAAREKNVENYELEKKIEKLEAELKSHNKSTAEDDKQKTIDMLIENAAAEKALLQRAGSEKSVENYELEKKIEKLEAQLKGPQPSTDDKQRTIDMLIENAAVEKALLQRAASEKNIENYELEKKIEKLELELKEARASSETPQVASEAVQDEAPTAAVAVNDETQPLEPVPVPGPVAVPAPVFEPIAAPPTADTAPTPASKQLTASKWADAPVVEPSSKHEKSTRSQPAKSTSSVVEPTTLTAPAAADSKASQTPAVAAAIDAATAPQPSSSENSKALTSSRWASPAQSPSSSNSKPSTSTSSTAPPAPTPAPSISTSNQLQACLWSTAAPTPSTTTTTSRRPGTFHPFNTRPSSSTSTTNTPTPPPNPFASSPSSNAHPPRATNANKNKGNNKNKRSGSEVKESKWARK